MFRKIAGALTALTLAGLGVIGVSTAASAHSADVTGVATCQTNGTYTIKWTVKTSNVPSPNEGEVKVIDPENVWLYEWTEHKANHGLPALKPNATFTWTQTGVAGTKTSATAKFQIDWKDGFSHDPEGTITLGGDCKDKTPPNITPTFPEPTPPTCDADGSFDFSGTPAENPNGVERDGYHLYVSPAPGSGPGDYKFTAYKIGGAGNADYPYGTKLVGDVTKTITVLPRLTGHQCDVTIDAPTKPDSTDECGTDNDGWVQPADTDKWTWSQETNKNGSVTITATAKDGYTFGDAKHSWTKTFSDEACPPLTVSLPAPIVKDLCGLENDHYGFEFGSTPGATVERDGKGFVATPDAGYVFGEVADGWVVNEDGTATFAFNADDFTDAQCGETPPPTVEYTDWVDSEWVCDDTTTVQTRTATTTTSTYAGNGEFTEKVTSETQTRTRDLSKDEQKKDCLAPNIDGSVVAPVCSLDAPYLDGTVSLDDPDNQSTDDGTATITLTDGTNTWKSNPFPIGDFHILWPGAEIGSDGHGITWPGYITNADGTYTKTDGNFAWTRGENVTGLIEVNPSKTVEISYPPSSPDCLTEPPVVPEKPKPWSEGVVSGACDYDLEVWINTYQYYDIDYALVGGQWQEVVTDTGSYTDQDTSIDCTGVKPPGEQPTPTLPTEPPFPTEPPAPTDTPTPVTHVIKLKPPVQPQSLAHTGSDDVMIFGLGGTLLIAAGVFLVAAVRRRKA